jgi:hypothetical protein
MYVADEAYRVLGQIVAIPNSTTLELAEGAEINLEALPDVDGDGQARLWMLDIAAGDTVVLPSRAELAAPSPGDGR